MSSYLFIPHSPLQFEVFDHWAAILNAETDLQTCILLITDDLSIRLPSNHSYQKVFSLQSLINKQSKTELSKSIKYVANFEKTHEGCTIGVDWSIDRAFQNIHLEYDEAIKFTHQVILSISDIINQNNVIGALSEKLFLPQRITHYLLAKSGRRHILPLGDRFFTRFYFEDGLNDWSWNKIREKYASIFSSERMKFHKDVTNVYQKITREKYKKIFSDNTKSKVKRTSPFSKIQSRSKKRYFDNIYAKYLFGDFKTGFKSKIHRKLITKRNSKYYSKVTSMDIPENRFILFLFHMQPEYTIDGIAYQFYNQVEFISTIAKNIPADISIVVKENPRLIGAINRPPDYYTELLRHPNIVFLHHSVDAHDLIKKSTIVLTLTGTVGIEALLMGKPLIVVGNIFYRFFDRVIFSSKIDDIIIKLRTLLEGGYEEFLNTESQELFGKRVLQAFYDATYPGQMYNGYNPDLHRGADNKKLLQRGFLQELQDIKSNKSV